MNRRTFIHSLGASVLAKRLGATAYQPVRILNGTSSSESPANTSGDLAWKPVSTLLPIPASVKGVQAPVIDLGGRWSFTSNPPEEFWRKDLDLSGWSTIDVPGEFTMQGFSVVENTEYPCRRKFTLPGDFAEKRIFLRFDGVYGYARVWVNGVYIRDHFGGFTSWDCEITQHVTTGQPNDLVLGIADRSDDISQASYYAKHSVAGVLRPLRLFALPQSHIEYFSATATLDSQYENGILHLITALSIPASTQAEIALSLTDSSGTRVSLDRDIISLTPQQAINNAEIRVKHPQRWDAEHPHLHTLEATLVIDRQAVQMLRREVGFRVVERRGNQLLVNGQPVKLRGACRHSIHPIYGRALPPAFDERDAVLFKDANINFVRTSHYPPTETFLAACDRHGIYVEEETAVCWSNVGTGPSSNAEFTSRYVRQFQEMLERDHEHASVLFWSLGNESQWGDNLAAEYRYAREHDPTRPLIFSYPDTVPWGKEGYDIYSKHYADVESDLGSQFCPVLHDEFAHIPCYDLDTLRGDPGVRDFWGKSIALFGDKFLTSDGCLGGSIWAGIDEVFLLPNGPAGYGPWGIIDGWRRTKPEHWLTKKAYSPIRINDQEPLTIADAGRLLVPVFNAFDHTNLSELEIKWAIGKESGHLIGVDVPPHHSGQFTIPAQNWRKDDLLDIQFLSSSGSPIDHFKLLLQPRRRAARQKPTNRLSVEQSVDKVLIKAPNLAITVNRATGLIANATCGEQLILEGGPYLCLEDGILDQWLLKSCEITEHEDAVVVCSSGEYGSVQSTKFDFVMTIDAGGLITTRYSIPALSGKHARVGIAYLLPNSVSTLAWDRQALWSVYPDNHIGRPKGVAPRTATHAARLRYREEPSWPWQLDMSDPFLFGKDSSPLSATNDFRSLKQNVWSASCILADGKTRARVEASGEVAVCASPLADQRIHLSIFNFWSYPDIVWGNYTGFMEPPAQSIHQVMLRLTAAAEE
jgi:hypothetical protein